MWEIFILAINTQNSWRKVNIHEDIFYHCSSILRCAHWCGVQFVQELSLWEGRGSAPIPWLLFVWCDHGGMMAKTKNTATHTGSDTGDPKFWVIFLAKIEVRFPPQHQICWFSDFQHHFREMCLSFQVIKANIFSEDELAAAFTDHEAVISCLGTEQKYPWQRLTFYEDTIKPIVGAMRKTNIKKLLYMTSCGTKGDSFLSFPTFTCSLLRVLRCPRFFLWI